MKQNHKKDIIKLYVMQCKRIHLIAFEQWRIMYSDLEVTAELAGELIEQVTKLCKRTEVILSEEELWKVQANSPFMRAFAKVISVIDQPKSPELSNYSKVLVIDKFEKIRMIDPFHFKEPKQKKLKLVISQQTLDEMD